MEVVETTLELRELAEFKPWSQFGWETIQINKGFPEGMNTARRRKTSKKPLIFWQREAFSYLAV
jgi:hypothetical protein